jgi:hypothetical protein
VGSDGRGNVDLPDTGARASFGSGLAVREADPNKPMVECISPWALMRLGLHFTAGAKKYGDARNWERGMPYMRYAAAIMRHLLQFIQRDESEDHIAAIMWNAQCIAHHQEVGPDGLDDRPRYDT